MRIEIGYPPPTAINTEEEARALMTTVDRYQDEGAKPAIDTETTGLDINGDCVIVWSICFEPGSRYCLSADLLPVFEPLFSDPKRSWWFTNAKFDHHMLANSGINFQGKAYCTLPADWLLDDTKAGMYRLKQSIRRHFNINMMNFKDVFPRKRDETIADVLMRAYKPESPDWEKAIDYASSDAWHTFKLGNHLEHELGLESLWKYVETIYMPMTEVLWNMERRGIMMDPRAMAALRRPLTAKLGELERQFTAESGRVLNFNSTPQLRDFFFGELGREPRRWTSGGKSGNRKPSLGEEQLKEWEEGGDILAKCVRERRKVAKLISTYIDGLSKWLDGRLRIHTTFNQHRTATGRLSSSDPALQNIPIRGDLGPRFRECFIAGPGKVLLAADYAQLEQALMAHFSQDPNMLAMVREGKDIHCGSTAIMNPEDGCTYEEVLGAKKTKEKYRTDRQQMLVEWRAICKNMSFGVNYQMGDKLLATKLGCTIIEAKNRKAEYLSQFPNIAKYVTKQHEYVREHLKVYSVVGRPRRLWGALAGGKYLAEAERMAVNTPIQGSGADVVARAMMRCHDSDELKQLDAKMLLQVHDEVVFEIPEENAEAAIPIVKRLMEEDPELGLSVPMRVDPVVGKNWNEAKD